VEKNRNKKQLNRFTFVADQLIGFLKPDHEVELLMRKNLAQYPTLRWQVYRHLHELRLLKEMDIKDMEELGATINDPNEKIKWAEEISFYGSDAGLDVFENLLSVPFDPEGLVNERGGPETNVSLASYVSVARAIRYLGEKAIRLLPKIKERESEVFEAHKRLFGENIANQSLNLFREIDMYMNGKFIPYSSARNRSGLLYPPGYGAKDKSPNSSGEGQFGKVPLQQGKKQRNPSFTDNVKTENHIPLYWWILGLLGVFFVFFFVIRKRIGAGFPNQKSN
jgi:hypothetical protein